jgi:hypothetical protein
LRAASPYGRRGLSATGAPRASRLLLLLLLWFPFLPSPAPGGAIEPFLASLADDPVAKTPLSVSPLFAWDLVEASRGRARVLVRKDSTAEFESLRAMIERIAPSAVWEGEDADLGQVVVDWRDLRRIADLPGVSNVFRSPRPLPCADARSEGLDEMRVPEFQEAGYRGSGSRVAILDLGFDGYERFLGNELGDDVVVRSFYRSPAGRGDIGGGGIDHGIACAEIVHDIAPGARLYLVNIESLVDLRSAVKWLTDEHVSVISHSVGWYFGGLNGHGPINDIADQAARDDILWINAAGNEADRHTWTEVRDTDSDSFLEFDGSGDEELDFTQLSAGDTLELALLWDDWPRARAADLILELVDSEDHILASTQEQSIGNPYAARYLAWESEGGPVAARIRSQGNVTGLVLHVFRIGGPMEEHVKADRSLLVPADTPTVLTVGAVRWDDLTLEPFSSRGSLEESAVVKPEICGPDRVTTRIYGSGRFFGTSAATPHVAGAAGLLVAAGITGGVYDVQWTREELVRLLRNHAMPLQWIDPLDWGFVRMPLAAPPAARAGPEILRNPASGLLRWSGGGREAEILDVDGRVVARCAGSIWDGRARDGRPAPAGVYWLRCPGSAKGARFVWLGR